MESVYLSRPRKAPHSKSRTKRKGGGLTHAKKRETVVAEEVKGKLIPMVDPDTGETFLFNPPALQSSKESKEYWALARKIKAYKAAQERAAGVEKPISVGGAKRKIETAIRTGKLSNSEMWKMFNEYKRQKYKKKQIYRFIAETLTKERKTRGLLRWTVSPKTKMAITPRTVQNWFNDPANRPPEKEKKKKGKLFIKDLPEWERFLEETKDIKDQGGYITGVMNFYDWMKEKGRSLDPDDWTHIDFRNWTDSRVRDDGKSTNTMRYYAVGFRRFMELGCNRPQSFLRKCHLKRESTKKKKPKPGEIRFFPSEQYDNYVKNVPHSSYKAKFKIGDSWKTREISIKNKADRLELVAAARLSGTTAARCGTMVSAKKIGAQVKNKDLYDNIAYQCTGTSSIRLEDISFNNKIQVADARDPSKIRYESGIAILKWINEKRSQQWVNIPLSDKTRIALEEYLRERFKLSEDVDLNNFLYNYTEDKKAEFDDLRRQLIKEKEKIDTIKAPDVKEEKTKQLGKKLLAKYNEFLLFPCGANKLRHSVYCTVDNAIKNDSPVLDDMGRPWTAERLLRERKGVWHLWRKSSAQNKIRRKVPLQEIADSDVGWTNLDTLRDYYGLTPRSMLNTTYMQVTRFF